MSCQLMLASCRKASQRERRVSSSSSFAPGRSAELHFSRAVHSFLSFPFRAGNEITGCAQAQKKRNTTHICLTQVCSGGSNVEDGLFLPPRDCLVRAPVGVGGGRGVRLSDLIPVTKTSPLPPTSATLEEKGGCCRLGGSYEIIYYLCALLDAASLHSALSPYLLKFEVNRLLYFHSHFRRDLPLPRILYSPPSPVLSQTQSV